LLLIAIFSPVLVKLFGHPPNEFHQDLIDPALSIPKGAHGGITKDYLLGVDPTFGRDVFSRIVTGARISLLVALLSTFVAVGLGTLLGVTAGYFGGWVDAVIGRLMDLILAFPQLLFAIAIGTILLQKDSVGGLKGDQLSVSLLVVVIGFFGWPYIGRIIRGQTISLREREFVDAARSIGATNRHIIFKELLPNLAAPVLIYSTLLIPTNILFEAALSFLGVGVRPPTPTWGGMLAEAVATVEIDPTYMFVPGLALFITVLSFNLLGDGLRDALDPRAGRG
ncbi:MAG: ABC transporter permease, partial [Actinomycetota bacterium]|nr:ABC transporter permease [Actinomycetota bacterium]